MKCLILAILLLCWPAGVRAEEAENRAASAATRSNFYMIPNEDDPRKGFVISTEKNTNTAEKKNFEFCNGDRANIDLSTLIVADADCNGFPTGPFMAAVENLEGAKVYDNKLAWVGEVSDLIVSDESNNIESLVVDVGGFLGIGEKPVAIDYKDIDIQRSKNGDYSIVLRSQSTSDIKMLDPFDM